MQRQLKKAHGVEDTKKILLSASVALACELLPAQAREATAFEAFKSYCIDTKAAPAQVSQKVLAKGGVPIPSIPNPAGQYYSRELHMSIYMRHWNLGSGRNALAISAFGLKLPPSSGSPILQSESCSVTVEGADTRGKQQLKEWSGVSSTTSEVTIAEVTKYTFKDIEGKHLPLALGWQTQSSNFDGAGVWDATLTENDGKTAFLLKHSWNAEKD